MVRRRTWGFFSNFSTFWRAKQITDFQRCAGSLIPFLVLVVVQISYCFETDLTFDLPPTKYECFFQNVKENFTLEVEYQVLDGGDLDINFVIENPFGVAVVGEKRKQDGVHNLVAEPGAGGEYKICFDNTFSSFSSKLVYFEVIVESDKGEDYYDELEMKKIDFTTDDDIEDIEVKIEDIQESLSQIKSSLSKAIHFQESRRATESRHRNVAESNFIKVNTWSVIQSCVMVSVGLVQVYLIRSLFDQNNKLYHVMRRRS